jgi:hypothetical protein
MTGKAKRQPICPGCSNQEGDELYGDTSTYWDFESQAWEMSDGGGDEMYCGHCNWSGRLHNLIWEETPVEDKIERLLKWDEASHYHGFESWLHVLSQFDLEGRTTSEIMAPDYMIHCTLKKRHVRGVGNIETGVVIYYAEKKWRIQSGYRYRAVLSLDEWKPIEFDDHLALIVELGSREAARFDEGLEVIFQRIIALAAHLKV